MKTWMRWLIVVAIGFWMIGIAPAFIFLPSYRGGSTGERHSYAVYWVGAPLFALIAGLGISMLRSLWPVFTEWLRGRPNETDRERERRIADLEREVGIK